MPNGSQSGSDESRAAMGAAANGGASGADAAVRYELDAAIKSGSVQALTLFLKRHPDHADAARARRCLAARRGGQDEAAACKLPPNE